MHILHQQACSTKAKLKVIYLTDLWIDSRKEEQQGTGRSYEALWLRPQSRKMPSAWQSAEEGLHKENDWKQRYSRGELLRWWKCHCCLAPDHACFLKGAPNKWCFCRSQICASESFYISSIQASQLEIKDTISQTLSSIHLILTFISKITWWLNTNFNVITLTFLSLTFHFWAAISQRHHRMECVFHCLFVNPDVVTYIMTS